MILYVVKLAELMSEDILDILLDCVGTDLTIGTKVCTMSRPFSIQQLNNLGIYIHCIYLIQPLLFNFLFCFIYISTNFRLIAIVLGLCKLSYY